MKTASGLLAFAAGLVAVAAALCLVLDPSVADSRATASDGTLYGISANVGFVEIDPDSGKVTPIGVPIPNEGQAQNLATLDKQRGIYYIIGYNFTTQVSALIGINVKNGDIVTDLKLPYVSAGFVGVGQAVDVDPTNGEVFTVGLMADNLHHIYRVNPRSGSMKHLANCGYINVLGGAHTYDMGNDLLWLQYGVTVNNVTSIDLFAFNAQTGAVAHKITEENTKFLATLSYDQMREQLVGFGFDSSTMTRTVLSLDGETGSIKLIGTVDGFAVDNGGIATIDTYDNTLYGQLQPTNNSTAPFYLVGVDVTTAKVLKSAPLCAQSANCPWSMEYAPNPKF